MTQEKKIETQPVENDLDKVKKHLDEGGIIYLPPDTTPIHNIPVGEPEPPDTIPVPPIDWDVIRKHLERGGKIDFKPRG